MAEAPIDPDTFDLIVIGTGLPQAIIAAAAAASGRTVLHLDALDYYGTHWASFPLDDFSTWVKDHTHSDSASVSENGSRPIEHVDVNDGANPLANGPRPRPMINDAQLAELGLVSVDLDIDDSLFSHGHIFTSEGSDLGSSRSYNLDLTGPKVAFCNGSLVNVLLKSGASNYMEFKSIEAIYLWTETGFAAVPSSRSDVFKDRSLSLAEKRYLMRFFKLVQDFASGEEVASNDLDGSFAEFLQRQQLPLSIQIIIKYAVALLNDSEEAEHLMTRDGLTRLSVYFSSIGRFPNAQGAFLYPLYGQGELPQAFCRAAAVNGALYVLRRGASGILLDKDTHAYRGIHTSSGQLLYSQNLVVGHPYAITSNMEIPEILSQDRNIPSGTRSLEVASSNQKLARFVCLTDMSLQPGQSNILLIFPPRCLCETLDTVVRGLQLSSNASICPRGMYVVYFAATCTDEASARQAFQAISEHLFVSSDDVPHEVQSPGPQKPKRIWSAFYTQNTLATNNMQNLQSIGCCPNPDMSLDYQNLVMSTEKVFHTLFGNEEWFQGRGEIASGGEASLSEADISTGIGYNLRNANSAIADASH